MQLSKKIWPRNKIRHHTAPLLLHRGNVEQVWFGLLSVSRASPFLSPAASHPVQLMWPLSTRRYHRRNKTKRAGAEISLINIFVRAQALSEHILSRSADVPREVCGGAPSAK
ncbi:unnamed protein product [Pleuronectes platessa]|uniref:Uncharacterized protein n=1 Tax=Pleuronectes platessa TaxID=8262 RepID=A0A9N7Y5U4_PLEPL|nr:unnamed protein product [Pleuronectes platessa]